MFKPLLFSLLLLSQPAIAATFIQLDSEPGEHIGQGRQEMLTEPLRLNAGELALSISQEQGYSFVFTAGQKIKKLQPGVYKNVQGLGMEAGTRPTMQILNNNRSCTYPMGEFIIYEYDLTSSPKKVALDFIHTCNSFPAKLRGYIRMNSDVPHPTSQPIAIIQGDSLTTEEKTISLTGAESWTAEGKMESYHWTQSSGKAAVLQNADSAEVKIQLPKGITLGGEKASFKLTVTNSAGMQDSEEFSLHIASKSDPQSYVLLESDTNNILTKGRPRVFNLNNSRFTTERQHVDFQYQKTKSVSVDIWNDEYWFFRIEAPGYTSLDKGLYPYAETMASTSNTGAAGLHIYTSGRSCNNSVGSFNITQFLMKNEKLEGFKANFEHRCENMAGPLLKGVVAINAFDDSVPEANAGKDFEDFENNRITLDASGSIDTLGSISEFHWELNNKNIKLEHADQAKAYFVAPALADRQPQTEYLATLKVVDNEGFQASDTVKITVKQNNKAPVANDDSAELVIGGKITLQVLANDTDLDGRMLPDSIRIMSYSGVGGVYPQENGTIEYIHTGTEAADLFIKYSVEDNDGAFSNTATVRLKVKKPGEGGSGGSVHWPLFTLLFLMLTIRRSKRHFLQ